MHVDAGDTAWVLGSAALVLFMTPGLALFYGGMVRSKHVLAMTVQNLATIAVAMKFRFRYDDALDVVGTLVLGLLAMHGAGLHLLGEQALAVAVTIGWAFTLTYAVATAVQRTVGLRVSPEAELEGLDTAVHAESAYDFGNVRAGRIG